MASNMPLLQESSWHYQPWSSKEPPRPSLGRPSQQDSSRSIYYSLNQPYKYQMGKALPTHLEQGIGSLMGRPSNQTLLLESTSLRGTST